MLNRNRPQIVIVGAGPAGLTLGRMLRHQHGLNATIVEKADRVGGRCYSEPHGDHIVEYGTCYATRAHRDVLRWMRELNMPLRRIRNQAMDGRELMKFIASGGGEPFLVQVARYLRDRRALFRRLDRRDAAALPEASMPVLDWLNERNLGKVEKLMYRLITTLGYGFLEEVSTLQALRWVDLDLVLTGLLKATFMPVEGWQEFWNRVAADLDVRTSSAVTAIRRDGDGPMDVQLVDGTILTADILVCATSLIDFFSVLEPTPLEQKIASSIRWGAYSMTLLQAGDWFEAEDIHTWSDTSGRGSSAGRMFVARREHFDADIGGQMYSIGQRVGEYSPSELQELAVADVESRGGAVNAVLRQEIWSYFPEYDRDAVANGLPYWMQDVQGQLNTFFTGASFSHEAVSNISVFNKNLAAEIAGVCRRDLL